MRTSIGLMVSGLGIIAFVLMFGTTVGDIATTILGEVVIVGTNITKSLTVQWFPPVIIVATILVGVFITYRGFMGLIKPNRDRDYYQ